jgi:hypothetical protein
MIIKVEKKICMTKLGLLSINDFLKKLVKDRELCYLQHPRVGKLKSRKLKNIKKLDRERKGLWVVVNKKMN